MSDTPTRRPEEEAPHVHHVHDEHCPPACQPPCGRCLLEVADLGVTIGGKRIIEHVSFQAHCGELVAIIGPNGAGKTTLLKALLGQIPHTGRLVYPSHPGIVRPPVGYVPQHLQFDALTPMTVLDLFALSLQPRPVLWGTGKRLRRSAEEALERVECGALLERRLGALSGGELQRVLLALALEPLPSLLLLDEPVSGVDLRGMELFYQLVHDVRRHFDLAVLLVSHDLRRVAQVADKAVLIERERSTVGTPAQVLASPGFRALFGEELRLS